MPRELESAVTAGGDRRGALYSGLCGQHRGDGQTVLYGDVLRPRTLDQAGIVTAGSLILSADIEDAAGIIRQARLLNPALRVLTRCARLRDAPTLRRAGAGVVAAGAA